MIWYIFWQVKINSLNYKTPVNIAAIIKAHLPSTYLSSLAWPGRLDMWLRLCPNDLLTCCAMLTGSVGLIGDGYQYNTGKLRPGHADHFEYFVAKWLSTALEIESVVATGVGSTTLNKSLALVVGVFTTALPASVSMAGHLSIHPNLKDGENAYWILLELHFTHFFFMRSTDNFKKAKSNFFLTL